MWANAQRDSRPAKYRWRPLFNAAKFGSAASGPKFTILWGHVEEILLLNKFFSPIVDTCLSCEGMYCPTKLCDGAQMAYFWRLLGPAYPESRVQHISDLHSKFALGPHHVSNYGRLLSILRPLRLGEEKKKEGNRTKYNVRICYVGQP